LLRSDLIRIAVKKAHHPLIADTDHPPPILAPRNLRRPEVLVAQLCGSQDCVVGFEGLKGVAEIVLLVRGC